MSDENILNFITNSLAESLRPHLKEIVQSEFNKLKNESKSDKTEPELLTEHQLAERLQKSKPTLWSWRKKGIISYKKINRSIYYDYAKVLQELKDYNLK